ncbi:phosphoenolpyruvate--protein phosphotransferase [Teredinibacter turnerae]|uniref:phosphoenolpyruvate--protein phosphotransferase n=1 Tax=Teredinibacter turnerae TaxID=2426 RepID=UPI00036DDAE8|nr:phosphoenolpyruvate--protein phosphotransferase [Teredinibacter turnerae]
MKTNSGETSVLSGTTISPGMAEGQIYLYRDILAATELPTNKEDYSVDAEIDRLDCATVKITEDLLHLADRVEKEINLQLAGVFGAHSAILNDSLLKEELRKEIIDNLVSASSAVKSVFLRWENRFLLMESAIAREKGEDFRDISVRLRNALANVTGHALEHIPSGCILVAQRLLPSETVFLVNQLTRSVLLEFGTVGSHAALFTRQMNVPCIAGIKNILNVLPDNGYALVDARKGIITVNPNQKAKANFKKRIKQYGEALKLAKSSSRSPSVTQDGIEIVVNANVGCIADSRQALEFGADGVGLYRLEQFYIGRSVPPSAEELLEEMRLTLSPFKAKPVCIRLLDIGSDKPMPFIGFMAESNPALGRRGIRLMREYPELLNTQLQAILGLKKDFDVQILIPMVTTADDVTFVKQTLQSICAKRGIRPPLLGAMIETPAAALSASDIAPYVDFMSFGTNDLTQYTFAADRENAAVAAYYNDISEVIFRLIGLVHDDVPMMPLSVCGELAGREAAVSRLLALGVRSLSVAAPLIPSIKESIRKSNLSDYVPSR